MLSHGKDGVEITKRILEYRIMANYREKNEKRSLKAEGPQGVSEAMWMQNKAEKGNTSHLQDSYTVKKPTCFLLLVLCSSGQN